MNIHGYILIKNANLDYLNSFNQNIMKSVPKMIGIIFFLSIFISCSPSTSEIAQNVKISFQETLDEDPDFSEYDLKVKNVDVMHESGNSYRGFAYVIYKNKKHNVRLDILADGEDVMWEAPEGSFLFLEEELFDYY